MSRRGPTGQAAPQRRHNGAGFRRPPVAGIAGVAVSDGLFGPGQKRLQAAPRVFWPSRGGVAAGGAGAAPALALARRRLGAGAPDAGGGAAAGGLGHRRSRNEAPQPHADEDLSSGPPPAKRHRRSEESPKLLKRDRSRLPVAVGATRRASKTHDEGRPRRQGGPQKSMPSELVLKVPANSNLLGYLSFIKAELRAVVFEREPLLSRDCFLEQPRDLGDGLFAEAMAPASGAQRLASPSRHETRESGDEMECDVESRQGGDAARRPVVPCLEDRPQDAGADRPARARSAQDIVPTAATRARPMQQRRRSPSRARKGCAREPPDLWQRGDKPPRSEPRSRPVVEAPAPLRNAIGSPRALWPSGASPPPQERGIVRAGGASGGAGARGERRPAASAGSSPELERCLDTDPADLFGGQSAGFARRRGSGRRLQCGLMIEDARRQLLAGGTSADGARDRSRSRSSDEERQQPGALLALEDCRSKARGAAAGSPARRSIFDGSGGDFGAQNWEELLLP